jgi:hypothetical protein
MSLAPQSMFPAACLGRWLRGAAGVLFVGLIVLAPLNFGSTRAGGPELLAAGCAAAALLWAAASVCRQMPVRVPPAAAISAALLTVAAMPWITGLAAPTPVAAFTRTHFAAVASRWPHSIVWRTPENTLVCTLALAAAALALIDLARSRRWALTFAIALTATAAAVGMLAMLQNYTRATGIYWRADGRMPGNFNGTFFHHTAAGAYFNTAWPLAVALTWLAWDRTQLAAVLVAPFVLGSGMARGRRFWLGALGVGATVALLIAVAGRASTIGERWQLMFAAPPPARPQIELPEAAWPALVRADLFIASTGPPGFLGDRGASWGAALRSIGARPLAGHGPGNWIGAASQHSANPYVRTFFLHLQFAHQDLLQSAVEWGIPAALGWWGLLAGSIAAVIGARRWRSPLHRRLGIAAACALAAVLLQAQGDFPMQIPAIALNASVLAALGWAGSTTAIPL